MYERHGMRGTRIWQIWANMKARCHIKSSSSYYNYGARGINVCDEWRNSFKSFMNWSYRNGYSDELTIERKYVNGNYEPSNCCWIPKSDQGKNKRNNHYLEINGEIKTIAQWSEETGINWDTIDMRIKHGFRKDNILGSPQKRMVTIDGVTKQLGTWAKEYNLKYYVLKNRVNKGYTGKELLLPVGEFKNAKKNTCPCS